MSKIIALALLLLTHHAHAERLTFEDLLLSNEGTCNAIEVASTSQEVDRNLALMDRDIRDSGFSFSPTAFCELGGVKR